MAVDLTPDLTEELYDAIKPYLPVRPSHRPKGGRPFLTDDKAALRGILYLLREGCKWQSIPCKSLDCPSGSTCWRRFKEWTALGVWSNAHLQLLDLLGEEGVLDLAQRAPPVAVVRAVLLLQGGEPVAQRGVADLDLREVADLALDVGVQVGGRLLLDSKEVLLVKHLHAIERGVEGIEQLLDDLGLLGLLLSRLACHVAGG